MTYFDIQPEAIAHLKRADEKMRQAIDQIGPIHREITPDLFQAVVFSIVSQMISTKAANTISARFIDRFIPFSPETLANQSAETIQQCGISMRKAENIRSFAERVCSGECNLEKLAKLSDDEIIKRLSSLRGIGRWTAEMILIFTLQRPDVMAWDDLALRRGLCRLHGLETLSKEVFFRYAADYSPYSTTASLYLWEYAHLSL